MTLRSLAGRPGRDLGGDVLEGCAAQLPEIEAAFLKQTVELDPVKRKALVADLQKISLPVLAKAAYYWGTGESAVYKRVQGYTTHRSLYNNTKMQDVWLNA